MSSTFFDMLNKRAKTTLLCIGLDPRADTAAAAVLECKRIIDTTSNYAAAYKPNAAFFECFGAAGWSALEEVIAHIPQDIPVLLDAKRGDIADTAEAYAKSAFQRLKAHAITASPYMGGDSLQPFLKYSSKGVFVLCKTSNKGSSELQCLQTNGQSLYETIAERAERVWNYNRNVGLVVGATDPVALSRARACAPTLWILVPGVGAQGGDLKAALQAGLRTDGSGLLINVSRAVTQAKDPRAVAQKLCEDINRIRLRTNNVSEMAGALVASQCVRFGKFTLKSGKTSPIYIDLRRLVTHPLIMRLVARHYARILTTMQFDRIVGLPYAALPIATAISLEMNVPLIYPRRERKDYGTKGLIEGDFQKGDRVVIVDDLVTTGETKVEAIEKLKAAGLHIVSIVVLIDREMGAKKFLGSLGYEFHAVATLSQLLPLWLQQGAITDKQMREVTAFMLESTSKL
ncbi:orotidine-5-phosphate decarboxylase/orotate phosphoribosyltransferase, putative [Trypanosoma equiperdum]|uniref:Orotidine 5'-phosphate decarboxylase n=1 Tax=Trypanosoma equiperdum TaxID=5694 RepID=A0A1G4I1C4_TRYEQ|nr:orotidine-5-phosphate decarboxylase/orotate phosphoribosyltransferase, putative [Trypanosoma equiperdum]